MALAGTRPHREPAGVAGLVRGAAATLAFALAVGVLAYAYMAHERFLYFWDWAGFHGVAVGFTDRLLADAGAGVTLFLDALRNEYNLIFAVPLVPALAVFGGSRTTYVVALAVLCLVPYALAVGMVCRRALPGLGHAALWGGAVLAVAVPPVWMTVMRGYPDVLAAAALLSALAILLGDPRLDRWSTVLGVAIATAAAVAIRRHVAYAGVAVLGAAALSLLLHWGGRLRAGGLGAVLADARAGRLARALALPVATLAVLMAVNPYFVGTVLSHDYGALYASYQLPFVALVASFADLMGPVYLGIAVAAVVAALAAGRLRCGASSALGLFGALWLALWFGLARHNNGHHILVALPPLAAAGVLMVADGVARAGAPLLGRLCLGATLAVAVAVALITYGPWQTPYRYVQDRTGLLSMPFGPLVRRDFDEVRRLIGDLRAGPQPTLVAASNGLLNFDLVAKAEPELFGGEAVRLAVLASPQVDSRDPLPVEDLLRARQVVVVRPLQYHLSSPAEQDVVRVLVAAFRDGWPVAGDFADSGAQYRIGGQGATARVYVRTRPTTLATALDTYRRVHAVTGAPPAQFGDVWHWTAEPAHAGYGPDGSRTLHFPAPPAGEATPLAVTLLRPVRGTVVLSGTAALAGPGCAPLRLEAMRGSGDGAMAATAPGYAVTVTVGEPVAFRFTVPVGPDGGVVGLRTGAGRECRLELTGLRVAAAT